MNPESFNRMTEGLLGAAPLLGCVLKIIQVILWLIVIYCCYRALLCFGGFLVMTEYLVNLKNGHKDKDGGEPKYPTREPTKFECLTYEPVRLLRQLFGMLHKLVHQLRQLTACKNGEKTLLGVQLGTEGKHNSAIWKFLAVLFGQFSKKSANFFSSLFCNVRRFLGLTHKCNDCKQPNDPSSPTAGGGSGGAQNKHEKSN